MGDASPNPAGTIQVPAARCPRLVNTLRGDVPTIHTVGILTAALTDDLLDERAPTPQNIRRNADLLADLGTYSTRQIKGRFGALVNPSVVANLPRARAVELGVKYGQAAVIFGYRKGGKRLGMGFEWICTDEAAGPLGHAVATRRMLLTPHAPNADRDHPDEGDENEVFSVRCKGCPFVIPFFDEDAAREEDFRGGKGLTYRRTDLPTHARPALDAYLAAEAQLAEALRERDRTGHYLYVRRGVFANARVALFQAMGDWKPFPLRWERTW